MSKQDIQDAIKDLNRERDRNMETFDSVNRLYENMEDDIILSKKQDERFLTESKSIPKDIEEIYEERRKLYIDFLKNKDELQADLNSEKEKYMKNYDEQLEGLNKQLEEYDEEKDEDSEEKDEDSQEKDE
ncbi:MAG: hypothetical protein K5776_12425 [Lachnospiraceae bacterium]|nr:hypothetical protein [Lachnospiraceae bacterium]